MALLKPLYVQACISSHLPLCYVKILGPISISLIFEHHHPSSKMTGITYFQVLGQWDRVALDLQWLDNGCK